MIEQIYAYFTIEILYFWVNLGVLPFWLILIFFPSSNINKFFVTSILPILLLSGAYMFALYNVHKVHHVSLRLLSLNLSFTVLVEGGGVPSRNILRVSVVGDRYKPHARHPAGVWSVHG